MPARFALVHKTYFKASKEQAITRTRDELCSFNRGAITVLCFGVTLASQDMTLCSLFACFDNAAEVTTTKQIVLDMWDNVLQKL